MRSYRDGKELSKQLLASTIEDLYHAPYIVIHRGDLHSILLKEARRLGVSIVLDSDIIKLDFDRAAVDLSNGKRYKGDIMLGADGERSFCRDALTGIKSRSYDSGDHVFRFTVKASDMIQHKDLALFAQPPCINLWVGPGAHAMTYALKRDDLLNVVLTCRHDCTQAPQHGPRKVEIEEVRKAISYWDERFHILLGLAQSCSKWTLFETPMPASWAHPSGRFILLGDSAHAMLPFL